MDVFVFQALADAGEEERIRLWVGEGLIAKGGVGSQSGIDAGVDWDESGFGELGVGDCQQSRCDIGAVEVDGFTDTQYEATLE